MRIFFGIAILLLMFNGCSNDGHNKSDYKISKDKVDLNVSFKDRKWDGKVVPKDEVCSDYNKDGGDSPSLIINNLPDKTNYIILSFSDETFKGMRDGGHGIFGYKVEKYSSPLTVPSVKGESFTLPKGFESIQPHRGVKYGKKEGVYLPPCSGGNGNLYTVVIEAIYKSGEEYLLLGDANITLGKY